MIRNFLFHRVNPKRDALWDPMDVQHFERCIKFITRNYETVLIEDLALTEKIKIKNHFATILFDDGYKDNIEYAAPILKKYNCKASFYVVTDCIDNNYPTWTHLLEHLFQFTSKKELVMDFDFLPPSLQIKRLNDKAQRLSYVKKLKPFLKTLPHEQRNEAIDRILKSFDDTEIPSLMMNWNDLMQLKSEGHYIGSHSVSHSMLGTMSDESEIFYELFQSGNRIKEMLHYFPMTISYPVGSYNETTKRLAREAGYKIGLAVKQNVYDPSTCDEFEIPRIELYNEPWWKTRMRISNALENFKKLIGYR
jgi:peptidoglycan/xylan/chitin deacetylase (PgdA/CDA1 family)